MKYFSTFFARAIGPMFSFIVSLFSFIAELLPLIPSGKTETVERQPASQTGKGVWAFATNLYRSQGRTYCWQAGIGA